jgi:hypothetical protein
VACFDIWKQSLTSKMIGLKFVFLNHRQGNFKGNKTDHLMVIIEAARIFCERSNLLKSLLFFSFGNINQLASCFRFAKEANNSSENWQHNSRGLRACAAIANYH